MGRMLSIEAKFASIPRNEFVSASGEKLRYQGVFLFYQPVNKSI